MGEAADGWEAVTLATRLCPDVVLMDIAMPGLRGMEATQEIHQRVPGVRVLALTMHDREEYFFAMLVYPGGGCALLSDCRGTRPGIRVHQQVEYRGRDRDGPTL